MGDYAKMQIAALNAVFSADIEASRMFLGNYLQWWADNNFQT
jgi:hypothetical protein